MKLQDLKFTQTRVVDSDQQIRNVIRATYTLEGQGRFEEDFPADGFTTEMALERIKAKHDAIKDAISALNQLEL